MIELRNGRSFSDSVEERKVKLHSCVGESNSLRPMSG